MVDLKMLEEKTPILKEICSEKEVFWKNPDKTVCGEAMEQIELGMEDVEDAERRLERFAPFIMKCFPETKAVSYTHLDVYKSQYTPWQSNG